MRQNVNVCLTRSGMLERRSLRRRIPRGMTLLEIMVVITIIGLVTAITSLAVMDVYRDARIKATRQSIASCEEALKLYVLRHGRYPETAQGLQALVTDKLIKRFPKDGWERELLYRREGAEYVITSYGADGGPGGEGADADIDSESLAQ